MLADKLRLEAAVPVAGHINRYLTELALQGFLTATIADVAGLVGDSLIAG